MYLRFVLIFFLLIITGVDVTGQIRNKIQANYFLLGTLNDYMGRQVRESTSDVMDAYTPFEEPLVTKVQQIFKEQYPDTFISLQTSLLDKEVTGYTLRCMPFAAVVNHFYSYNGSNEIPAKKELKGGVLKDTIFKTDEQKMAFIAGMYTRFGKKCDTAWCIILANSESKARVCSQLLASLNSHPTYARNENIPVSHFIYFHPDEKLKAYLSPFAALQHELEDNKALYFEKMLAKSKMRQ